MAAGEQKDKEGSTTTSVGKERAGSSSSSASRDEVFAARLADLNVGECCVAWGRSAGESYRMQNADIRYSMLFKNISLPTMPSSHTSTASCTNA